MSIGYIFPFPLQVGILSDPHIDPSYENKDKRFGTVGSDPPKLLMHSTLEKMGSIGRDYDFLIFPGDMACHSDHLMPGDPFDPVVYNKLKTDVAWVTNSVINQFPGKHIAFVIGNNDVLFHSQVPKISNPQFKKEYYTFIYNLYLGNGKVNIDAQNTENKLSILNGGYYFLDINDDIRILILNTLYFFEDNDKDNDPQAADDQFEWLEEQMRQCENYNRRVIIVYHVPFGDIIRYDGKQKEYIRDKYQEKYTEICVKYRHVLLYSIGAHMHYGYYGYLEGETNNKNFVFPNLRRDNMNKLMVNSGRLFKKHKFNSFYICRAISPEKGNNPGFEILTLDTKDNQYFPVKMEEYTFDLAASYGSNSTNGQEFWTYLYATNVNLDIQDLTTDGVEDFHKELDQDHILKAKYTSFQQGFPYTP